MVIGVDDILLAAGASAAAGAVSSAFGGGLDYEENQNLMREANQFNSAEAQKARDFSERMSSTAFQRSRADMEKAGINPMLMVSQGGASTPSSSSASASATPQTNRHAQAVGAALGTAKDTALTLAQLDKARAETKATDAQAAVNSVMANKVVQDTKTSGATAKNLEVQNNFIKANAKMTENNQWRSDKINQGLNNVVDFIDRVSRGGDSSSAKSVNDNPYRMDRYKRKQSTLTKEIL